MPSERTMIEGIRSHTARLAQAMTASRYWYERCKTEITQQFKMIEITGGLSTATWNAPAWRSFVPMSNNSIPRVTRVGMLIERGNFGQVEIPALLPIVGSRNVLIKATGAAKDEALQAMQSLMLRLLATLPPSKLRFTLIDPVGLGANVAGFMNLPEELIGGRAWTEANHIEQQLLDLTAHMEMIIQKYLRNRYATMEEYNDHAGEVAEPYRLLTIANFPVNFTDTSARRLVSIASNGPRTGVYVLATVDTEQPLPYGFNLADLERTATIIAYDNSGFTWIDPDFLKCTVRLDHLPPTEQFDHIVLAVGEAAIQASKVEVPFEAVSIAPTDWWQADTCDGLRVPIGRVGAEEIQYFELDSKMRPSVLVAGRPGSGKSTLLHVIITSLALTYSPDEIELYLVDFKKGVEFKHYATYHLPHARVVAIESEREFGLSVLRGLNDELKRRGDIFREAGAGSITNLRAYREDTGERMPRVLLLVDEFQEFFSQDDPLAEEAAQILERLVRMGRAFGIHVLLASQTLAGTYYALSKTTKEMVAVRIALQCSDADSRLILSEDNPSARLLSRPGEAIYNDKGGLVEGDSLFQIVWLPDEQRETYLQSIAEKAHQAGYVPAEPQIVFEGNKPARLDENRDLCNLLDAPDWPAPERAIPAWLGEPVEIKPHTAALFRRQTRSNLLILGQDEPAAVAMLMAAMVSLAAAQHPEQAYFAALDLTRVDAQWHGLSKLVAKAFPHQIAVVERRKVIKTIGALARLVSKRAAMPNESLGPSVYLVIVGLHRARDLRSEDIYNQVEAAQQLGTILRDGPEVGVHSLVWCSTYAGLNRILQNREIAEFGVRVALQMSAEDSNNLLDSPEANRLGSHRALLYDEERLGRLEKFRPYGLPEREWICAVGRRIQNRLHESVQENQR
jgi:S-DNA-T family DNA segregation ATPase FtsK/SpoIIIE